MAWLLAIGTIPVGIVGLVFEHRLRTIFAKPTAAAIFLTVLNGLILLAGERLRRRAETLKLVQEHPHHTDPGHDVGRDASTPSSCAKASSWGARRSWPCSRGSAGRGVTMVAGLLRGLDHEDAARLSFMLATPIIFAAGFYKLPISSGTAATTSAGRCWRGASPPASPPTSRSASSPGTSRPGPSRRSRADSLVFGISMIFYTTLKEHDPSDATGKVSLTTHRGRSVSDGRVTPRAGGRRRSHHLPRPPHRPGARSVDADVGVPERRRDRGSCCSCSGRAAGPVRALSRPRWSRPTTTGPPGCASSGSARVFVVAFVIGLVSLVHPTPASNGGAEALRGRGTDPGDDRRTGGAFHGRGSVWPSSLL